MDWFSWVVVPILIFCSRVADVSLGTLRLIYLSRGYRGLAPLVGFFEVLIWIVAVREVMINMRNVACVLAYAGGYAMRSVWPSARCCCGWCFATIPNPFWPT